MEAETVGKLSKKLSECSSNDGKPELAESNNVYLLFIDESYKWNYHGNIGKIMKREGFNLEVNFLRN